MLLAVMIVLEVAILWALVGPSSTPKPVIESINVPAKIVRGTLPGGSYEIVGGTVPGEPVLPSGVLVLDVKSDQFWVYEVWARTNHGWVQLQPGPGRGAFRNSLIAGVRLSQYRLWLARVGEESDERPLREAAGLLVPAALLLTRARTATSPPAQGRAPGSTPPHELRSGRR